MTHHFTLLDGKKTAKELLDRIEQQVAGLNTASVPRLSVILVGNDPASEVYVGGKLKKAEAVGIRSELHRFPADLSEGELLTFIESLNLTPEVNAILVQLPLPRHIDSNRVLEAVLPEKDVDGFHPTNLGKLMMGLEPPALSCTPAGIIHLMDAYDIDVSGKRAAVIGRSNIVGKPITMMLMHRNATVTVCHSRTKNMDDILRESDIIIAAAGQPGLVKAEAVKPGAVVVDVGINRLPDGKLVGDVDFESVKERAGYITPVPGGVGPMTIAMLMQNTLRLHQAQQGERVENLLFV